MTEQPDEAAELPDQEDFEEGGETADIGQADPSPDAPPEPEEGQDKDEGD